MKPPLSTSTFTYTFTFLLLSFSLSAAVPIRWTVETSRVQPAQFEAFKGESIALEAALQSYGKPLEIEGEPALYWQTNGMGAAWWTAPAAVSSNVLSATWTPAMDVGANAYTCFIGVTGSIYRAAFQLRIRHAPGDVPNELPLPVPTLDFDRVRVLHPPWPGIETVPPIISNTVTKAYVEALGITGGIDTNAVIEIVEPMIEGATNATLAAAKSYADSGDVRWVDSLGNLLSHQIEAETDRAKAAEIWLDGKITVTATLTLQEAFSNAYAVSIMQYQAATNYTDTATNATLAAANAYTDSRASAMTNVQFVYDATRMRRHDFDGNLYEATFPTGGTFVVTLPGQGGAEVEVAYHSSYDFGPGSSQFHHYYRSRTSEFPNMSADVSGSRTSRTVTFEIGHYNPASWSGRIAGPVTPVEFADPALVEYGGISLCPSNVELAVTTEQSRYGTNLIVRHIPMGDAQFVTPPYDRFATTNELAVRIAATDPAFSNAVVSVALPIGTNELAVLREIGGLPIGEGAVTIGGLLAALAAAVAWLKRKTGEIETAVGTANADLEAALNGGEA